MDSKNSSVGNVCRQSYLDNLKVWLIVLVVFHHAGQAYGDGGAWAYSPSNEAEVLPWIWHFFAVNAGFFMGLFFMISGYFVPTSFDKQGWKVFIKKKLMRLGIPFLVMGGIIAALSGRFEVAHMWFVESLLLFCLIYALIRCFFKPISDDCKSKPTIVGMLILGAVMGVGSYFIRQVSPQDHWIWPFGIPLPIEPAHYLQYAMMFTLGILARRFDWLNKMTNTVGVISLVIGCLLALGIYVMNGGWWFDFVWKWYGIYESLMCVFICFGLIWLFRQYFSGTFPFMKWCSDQAFGVYVVHLLLMLSLQKAFDGVWMGAAGKFWFIGIVTTILSFIIAALLRMIPGVKKVL